MVLKLTKPVFSALQDAIGLLWLDNGSCRSTYNVGEYLKLFCYIINYEYIIYMNINVWYCLHIIIQFYKQISKN